MRQITRGLVLALTIQVLGGCYPTLAKIQPEPTKSSVDRFYLLDYKPIKTDVPKTKVVTLSNGMRVHLMPDKELPIVNVMAMAKTGSIWDPAGTTGLAALTGAVWRSGGAASMPADALDEKLESMAASVETGIADEAGRASLSVMSKDLKEGLAIFADVLRRPRFDNDRLELARARMLDGIRRENDEPTGIGDRELSKLIYKGSPYGARPTMESVKSITRRDVVEFYKNSVRPSSVIMGVTGDFDEKDLMSTLEKLFGDWQGEPANLRATPKAADDHERRLYLAAKKLPQAVIRAGHLGLKRTDPDYQAVRVMDEILGGSGFASRLMQKVRTDKGLAYSVWSYNMGGRWENGSFTMGAETKTQSAGEVLSIFMDEVSKMRTGKVDPMELKAAKDSLINSFVFIFDTPGRILEQRMIIDYYGMPADYLETFREKVMKVTADDVLEAAKNHLRPDELKIVVVGDPAGLEKQLAGFGKVERISLREYPSRD
ncbi:MAG: insulinase family protein [Nitrospinae bacterium]|nr:insulinase family protein [Nitrospinota bacterium]